MKLRSVINSSHLNIKVARYQMKIFRFVFSLENRVSENNLEEKVARGGCLEVATNERIKKSETTKRHKF